MRYKKKNSYLILDIAAIYQLGKHKLIWRLKYREKLLVPAVSLHNFQNFQTTCHGPLFNG